MRLMLVEDDELLADGMVRALRNEGYTVDWVDRGKGVLPALEREQFDLLLLDLGLPDVDGVELLRKLRSARQTLPVLIVSARDLLEDRIEALDLGADDYLVKPFAIEELKARVRARLRRTSEQYVDCLVAGQYRLHQEEMILEVGKERIPLHRREYTLLNELMRHAGKVVTREKLESSLYGWDQDVASNALEVHIHKLRKKMGDSHAIETVRGVGYRMRPA